MSFPGSTVAGWREIRGSSLPCVGYTEVTQGITPFTGRRRSPPSDLPHPIYGIGFPWSHRRSTNASRAVLNSEDNNQPRPESIPGLNGTTSRSSPSDSSEGNQLVGQIHASGPSQPVAITSPRRRVTSCISPNRHHINIGAVDHIDNIARRIDHSAISIASRMANLVNNSPPDTPNSSSPPSSFSSSSLFSVSLQHAAAMVRMQEKDDDSRHCYFIHLKLRPLFSDDVIPGICLRKLPRLVNGIPLGAGFLSRDQLSGIRWRMLEGGHSCVTFVSTPLLKEEAEESKRCLRDSLMKQSPAVFGDMTVKASIVLSRCVDIEEDFVLNDIAVNLEEGLHFRD